MKKMLLLLALAIAAFSGCVEEEPSAEDLKLMMVASVETADTYRFSMEMNQIMSVVNHSETNETLQTMTFTTQSSGVGAIDMLAPAMNTVMDTTTSSELSEPVTQEIEMYMISDTIYTKIEGNWTKMEGLPMDSWDKQNIMKSQMELFNSSEFELIGSEKVNGEDSYKLKIVPDMETFSTIVGEQMGSMMPVQFTNITEIFEESEMKQTIWLSKESKLPLKAELDMKMKLTPELMGLPREMVGDVEMDLESSATVLYYDYNEPVEIELPPEAASAPSFLEMMMMSMMPPAE